MTDLIYVLVTVVFFVLMLAYVSGCERLGRHATDGSAKEQSP
ncbi:MAG: hypothetical protein U0163_00520 [Gemmatimonadaceae bacterium]